MRPGGCRLAVVVLLALASAAHGKDELQTLLENLGRTEDAGARRELVARLAQEPAVRAAERLRDLVRTDPDPSVRVAAAEGLGASPVREGLSFLMELVADGGPRGVRRAVARSIARRGGRGELAAALDRELARSPERGGPDLLGAGLRIEALAEDASLAAAMELERRARGKDVFVRAESLRALARHAAAREVVPRLLAELLAKHHDIDTVMAGLDVAESLAGPELREVVDVLGTFLEPEVQGAVEAAQRRLTHLDAVEAAAKARRDGYGAPAAVPDPPAPRPRVDIVYMFDASGSVCGHIDAIKKRIRREAQTLARTGCDFRLGLVAYRDKPPPRGQWSTLTLPLTYDLAKAEKWIDAVGASGCGTGSAMPDAFEAGLSRMGWRWGARRQIALISDSGAGASARASGIVRLHYLADHTRVDVWYLYRTRTQLPPDVAQLARIGGGVVESLE